MWPDAPPSASSETSNVVRRSAVGILAFAATATIDKLLAPSPMRTRTDFLQHVAALRRRMTSAIVYGGDTAP
jgi:uncharacterized protein with NAD-binding domain and iron-sulfur cluster